MICLFMFVVNKVGNISTIGGAEMVVTSGYLKRVVWNFVLFE